MLRPLIKTVQLRVWVDLFFHPLRIFRKILDAEANGETLWLVCLLTGTGTGH
jgi:hypothetical protein